MNEHINLVEILKDCPVGTSLYSPMFGEVRLCDITDNKEMPIVVTLVDTIHHRTEEHHAFTADGRADSEFPHAECMLFPSSENRDWSTFVVPKSLPKTWMEFCQMHDVQPDEAYINNESIVCVNGREGIRLSIDDRNLLPNKKTAKAMLALCQLIQLRDCYNDGWVADWSDEHEKKYTICFYKNQISTDFLFTLKRVLAFKEKEIRDKFLENFRDLIETAKPLL